MARERVLRSVAYQLAIALAYVLAFRLQVALPPLPGSAIAAIFFVPAIVRVFATLIVGERAVLGLFAGSLIIALQVPVFEPHMLWHAISSAASAPLALFLFRRAGLLKPQHGLLRRADPMIVLLFIASYAVINAGLHLLGLALMDSAFGSNIPYFWVMVAGDALPAGGGFALYRLGSRLLSWASSRQH